MIKLGNEEYKPYDIYNYKSDPEKVAKLLLENEWMYDRDFMSRSYEYYTSKHLGYNLDRDGKIKWKGKILDPDPDRLVYGYTVSKFSEEPHACREMYNLFHNSEHKYFGRIIDYEVPINRRSDKPNFSLRKLRNIDLVSQKGNIIYLIEMKRKPGKSSPVDSFLSCVLEITSYYYSLDFNRFVNDYSIESKRNKLTSCSEEFIFQKAIVIYEGSRAYRDIIKIKNDKLEYTKKFLKNRDIRVFVMKNTVRYAPFEVLDTFKLEEIL